ncbi:hypothetical protein B0H63DRAFT_519349 [Podospora didyma]|uniref:Uncharacterized protein n=1 Tax=Podospora didyma TaxID=330526 RepID=A0AAE0U3Y5_9PEZI|nr:hypothetical protein B0H63DRAFT_519349 [Podospora didyma]
MSTKGDVVSMYRNEMHPREGYWKRNPVLKRFAVPPSGQFLSVPSTGWTKCAAAYSTDGKQLASSWASAEGIASINIWREDDSGGLFHPVRNIEPASLHASLTSLHASLTSPVPLVFSPGGFRLASSVGDGDVRRVSIWKQDKATGQYHLEQTLKGHYDHSDPKHQRGFCCLHEPAFSSDGNCLLRQS